MSGKGKGQKFEGQGLTASLYVSYYYLLLLRLPLLLLLLLHQFNGFFSKYQKGKINLDLNDLNEVRDDGPASAANTLHLAPDR